MLCRPCAHVLWCARKCWKVLLLPRSPTSQRATTLSTNSLQYHQPTQCSSSSDLVLGQKIGISKRANSKNQKLTRNTSPASERRMTCITKVQVCRCFYPLDIFSVKVCEGHTALEKPRTRLEGRVDVEVVTGTLPQGSSKFYFCRSSAFQNKLSCFVWNNDLNAVCNEETLRH